jgi:long-subunit fatty acid transport protein
MRRLGAIAFAILFVLAALATRAGASPADAFGLGSEESGVGGASAARVHDFSAGYYNPAGLASLARPEASLGVLGFGSQLRVDTPGYSRTVPIADPIGVLVGGAAPLPLGGALRDRLYIGIALYIVPDQIVRAIAHFPEEAFYPLYDNRTQRLMVLPAIAARVWRGLSIGIGFNYLAGLGGRVSAAPGATRAVEARVDEQIFSVLAVNAGVRWQARRDLALALVYRQQFAVPIRTISRNDVAGQPIDLDVDAEALFTPHELVLGAAYKWRALLASLDVQWSHWSAWRGPYVTVTSQLPLVGEIDARPPRVDFVDTFSFRSGLEYRAIDRRRFRVVARGGYGFETQAAPASQPGVTNLLDGHKHRVAFGGGMRVWLGDRATMRLDAHAQFDVLQPETLVKRVAPAGTRPDPSQALTDEVPDDPVKPASLGAQISNPGWPRVSSGGFVWAAGLTLTVER